MRVEIARDVFTEPHPMRRQIQAVDRLLETFDEGRHDWVVDFDDIDDVATYVTKHSPTLAPTYIAMAEMAAVQNNAWTGTTQAGSVLHVPKPEVAEYSADLYRKAIIAVENVPGDKYFLVAVAHAFDARRLRDAIEREWVEFRHGGGSGLPAVAEEEAGHFHRHIRVVAVFDSDSLAPDHEGPNREKAKRLRDKRIAAYVLLRREAENYAPDRVLVTVGHKARAAKRVALMGRLLPHQRGHLDIKKGLPKTLVPEQKAIYAALDQDVRDGLSSGFGDGVLKRMHEMREELSEADFEAMDADAAADLRTLLVLIDSLI